MAKLLYESPAETERMMEEICEKENCREALRRVKANKGSPGVDAMSVGELSGCLVQHWLEIRAQLLSGTYRPQPVRRVEIPKPDGGMMRSSECFTKALAVRSPLPIRQLTRTFDCHFAASAAESCPAAGPRQAFLLRAASPQNMDSELTLVTV